MRHNRAQAKNKNGILIDLTTQKQIRWVQARHGTAYKQNSKGNCSSQREWHCVINLLHVTIPTICWPYCIWIISTWIIIPAKAYPCIDSWMCVIRVFLTAIWWHGHCKCQSSLVCRAARRLCAVEGITEFTWEITRWTDCRWSFYNSQLQTKITDNFQNLNSGRYYGIIPCLWNHMEQSSHNFCLLLAALGMEQHKVV